MTRWTDRARKNIAGSQGETLRGTETAKLGGFTRWTDQARTEPQRFQTEAKTPSQINRQDAAMIQSGVTRPSVDQQHRDHFAQTHPEYTGGMEGARTRQANTAVVQAQSQLDKAQTKVDDAQQKWNEVKLETPSAPASSYLSGGTSAPSLSYAAAKQYDPAQALESALTRDLRQAEGELKDAKELRDVMSQFAAYESLRRSPDFKEKSAYKTTKNGKEAEMNYFTGQYIEPGYDDLLYDVLNGDQEAASRALLYPVRQYKDVPEGAVELFNYIYATQGEEAAYKYMDFMAEKAYTGAEAIGLGAYKGTGLWPITEAIAGGLGDEQGKEFLRDFDADMETAQRQHPAAYGAGEAGGSLVALLGAGAAGKAIGVTAPVANSALAFGTTQAVRGAGDVATGRITPEEYTLSIAGSAAGGAVGSLAAQGVTSLGGAALDKTSKALGQEWLRRNVFANAINQGLGGAAFSTGNAVTRGAIDPNYNPSADELAKDAAVSFAFQTITSAVRLAGRTDQAKAALEQDVAVLKRDFETIAKAEMAGEITPTDTIELMKLRSATLRVTIEGTRYIGQGKKVDDALAFLDQMDDFLAEAAKHNAKTMLGSGAGGISFDSRQTTTTSEVTQDGADVAGVDGGAPDATTISTHQEDLEQLAKRYGVAYTDTARYALLARYQKSVMEGWLSPLVDFTLYEDYYQKIQNRIIGRVVGGVEIKEQSQHFLERLFGCREDPKTRRSRSGVELEDIFDCIENPIKIEPIKIDEEGRLSFGVVGNGMRITVNPETGQLIQVNPRTRRK